MTKNAKNRRKMAKIAKFLFYLKLIYICHHFFFLYSSLPTALIGTMGISKSRIKLSHTITCILHIHASHMPDGPLLGPLAQACTMSVTTLGVAWVAQLP